MTPERICGSSYMTREPVDRTETKARAKLSSSVSCAKDGGIRGGERWSRGRERRGEREKSETFSRKSSM